MDDIKDFADCLNLEVFRVYRQCDENQIFILTHKNNGLGKTLDTLKEFIDSVYSERDFMV